MHEGDRAVGELDADTLHGDGGDGAAAELGMLDDVADDVGHAGRVGLGGHDPGEPRQVRELGEVVEHDLGEGGAGARRAGLGRARADDVARGEPQRDGPIDADGGGGVSRGEHGQGAIDGGPDGPHDDGVTALGERELDDLRRVDRHLRLPQHAQAAVVELRHDLGEHGAVRLAAGSSPRHDVVAKPGDRQRLVEHGGQRGANLVANLTRQRRSRGWVDDVATERDQHTRGELPRLGVARTASIERDLVAKPGGQRGVQLGTIGGLGVVGEPVLREHSVEASAQTHLGKAREQRPRQAVGCVLEITGVDDPRGNVLQRGELGTSEGGHRGRSVAGNGPDTSGGRRRRATQIAGAPNLVSDRVWTELVPATPTTPPSPRAARVRYRRGMRTALLASSSLALAVATGCYTAARATPTVNVAWQGHARATLEGRLGAPAEALAQPDGATLLLWTRRGTTITLPEGGFSLRLTPTSFELDAAARPGTVTHDEVDLAKALVGPDGRVLRFDGAFLAAGVPDGLNLRTGLVMGLHGGLGRLDDGASARPGVGAYLGGMISPRVALVGAYTFLTASTGGDLVQSHAWSLAMQRWMTSRLAMRVGPALVLDTDPEPSDVNLRLGATGALSFALVRAGSFVLDARVDAVGSPTSLAAAVGVGVHVN